MVIVRHLSRFPCSFGRGKRCPRVYHYSSGRARSDTNFGDSLLDQQIFEVLRVSTIPQLETLKLVALVSPVSGVCEGQYLVYIRKCSFEEPAIFSALQDEWMDTFSNVAVFRFVFAWCSSHSSVSFRRLMAETGHRLEDGFPYSSSFLVRSGYTLGSP